MDPVQLQYNQEIEHLYKERVKVPLWLGMTLVPVFGFLDFVVFPNEFAYFMVLRLITSCFIAVLLFLAYMKTEKNYHAILAFCFYASVGTMISLMTRRTGGYASIYYAGLNLLMLTVVVMPWSIKMAIGTVSTVYGTYILPALMFDEIDKFPIFVNNNYFLLSTIIIAVTANFVGNRLRFKEFKSRFELNESKLKLENAKKELEQSYYRLQEMDQLKTQFFANISHELRTPLTLILAPLESILHRENLSGDRREDLNSMYQNGLRLLKLINNLLDLAKIDAGKMQLSHTKTDFTKFTKGIIASVAPLAEKKGISLSFTGSDQVREFYFDRDKIEKVFLNLIFNALKFTHPGGRVDVACEQKEDAILIRISDTGIGIAQENIHKLFNRFSQVDASSNRRFEGTGIGLALSKELIELHKGEIWAESELGKGTTMSFTLPYLTDPICIPEQKEGGEVDWTRSLHKAAEYATAGILQPSQPVQTTASNGAPAGAPKILVVEDNPDMLHFLVTQLQDDYQVVTAQNGVDGVQRAQTDLPNLILSDVMMPIKDGYQLCREVKENALTKHIPIVLISAKADLSMKIEGLEYGADDYLTKPFSCEEMRARIKSLLNQRGLETQLIHSEKMAALGLLVAGMAHEINNPISFAKVSLENLHNTLAEQDRLIKEGAAPDSAEMKRLNAKIDRAFSIIKTGLDRTEAIVSDLKAFVRKDEAQFRPTDLHEGLDSTLNLMRTELKDRITIVKEYGEIDFVEAVPGQINQVFMNLLQNAVHAITDRGEIRIKTWKEGEWVKISVKDNGVGIPAEHQKRIFEPFFTTKEAGKGTGLGLSVSYRILQSHNGEITVISQPGQGTEFVITLPVRQTISTAHQNTLGARGKETS